MAKSKTATQQTDPTTGGLSFERRFTRPGVHPFDEVEWELRDAVIANASGEVVFEQREVEVPRHWSQMATNVVVSKYFRGVQGSPERERSVKQLISRVVDSFTGWGREGGYFASPGDAETFHAELTHLILHQKMSFNSPVWFNVGIHEHPQGSACQPARALVSTPSGPVPIGDLVNSGAIGAPVFDQEGVTRIVAVKANGMKQVFRILLKNGSCVEATGDHLVLVAGADSTEWRWLRVDELQRGQHMREVIHAGVPVKVHTGRGVNGEPSWHWVMQRPAGHRHAIVDIEARETEEVFDIQTETGQYLTNNIVVHNCFINSVDDTMESILTLAKTEGMLFKFGSGTGSNLSAIRSSREKLAVGGTASGPLSFMKGYDAIAGAIKSGGATRRAAKMVILNADHPDIADFINCKVDEERKAHALIAAGYDPALDGPAYSSIFYQNANHSVRVTDEFMRAFESDGEWQTHYITSGKVADTYRARDLMRQISEAAWHCGDPGMQFDTTINEWHTSPASGRINASNPCFTGDTRLLTDRGWLKIAAIVQRAARGELVRVATQGADGQEMTVSLPERYMVTGHNPIVRLTFADGREVRCTPNHRFLTANRGMVEASALTETDDVLTATGPVIEFERAQSQLPLPAALRERARESYTALPLEWTAGLAEMLGHVAAAGTVAEGTVSWTYGEEARSDVLPAHRTLLQGGPGTSAQVTVTEGGTVSVRLDEGPLGEVFEALGLHRAGASGAGVPEVLFEAPAAAMSGFLRGMFDAAATVNPSGAPAARFISLPLRSRALAGDVQLLLQGLGISSVVRQDFVTGESGATAAVHEVRVSGSALDAFRGTVGFEIRSKREALDRCASTRPQPARRRTQLVQRQDDGVELTYNLTEPVNHSYIAQGLVAANCSEYMYLDDTACNLASLNLMRFVDERGDLKVDDFRHAVQLTISAQEMIVSSASYPTAAIEKNSHRYRTLGLGYANLGALLMSRGLAYDSEDGRAYAAAITSLMCGEAYAQSARIARAVGPCEGWKPNARPMQHVIDKHRKAARAIERTLVPSPLWQASSEVWDDAYQLGAEHGFRNMQVTVLAPTGTISFMMDCDTTGVEPDIALVKYKRLVGGGMLKIVNTTVPAALRKLGYKPTQVAEIVDFVDVHDTIEGAPHLKAEHLAVFDCAFKPARGQRSIHYMGHVRMMAATQPFISGAISKTVNLPNEATVEDIEEAYVQAWKMGLKAIAIYRDGCKVSQPMSTSKEQAESKTQPGTAGVAQGAAQAAAAPEPVAQRRRLPDERRSITHKFSIEGHEGYITVGMYDDGKPGEIFLVMAKEGSTISGLMDSFATAISLSLQYGVPLEALVQKFAHARFEPAGYTTNREIPIAKSIVDYIFRWLGTKFLSPEDQDMLGIVRRVAAAEPSPSAPVTPEAAETVAKAAEAPAPQPATQPVPVAQGAVEGVKIAFNNTTDAPSCPECGSIMVRNAACYKCLNCGATSGCS